MGRRHDEQIVSGRESPTAVVGAPLAGNGGYSRLAVAVWFNATDPAELARLCDPPASRATRLVAATRRNAGGVR